MYVYLQLINLLFYQLSFKRLKGEKETDRERKNVRTNIGLFLPSRTNKHFSTLPPTKTEACRIKGDFLISIPQNPFERQEWYLLLQLKTLGKRKIKSWSFWSQDHSAGFKILWSCFLLPVTTEMLYLQQSVYNKPVSRNPTVTSEKMFLLVPLHSQPRTPGNAQNMFFIIIMPTFGLVLIFKQKYTYE